MLISHSLDNPTKEFFQWQTKQIKVNSRVGSKRIVLLDSSNPDRRNRIRALSSSGELQATNKEAKRPSVAIDLTDKRTKRRIEREHNTSGPSRLGGPILVRPSQWALQMTLGTERSGSRFVARTGDGKPVIQLELFHDSVSGLKVLSLGFELLSGTTLEQAKALVDTMNERIVGVIVTPK
jgi:hypothetical protein